MQTNKLITYSSQTQNSFWNLLSSSIDHAPAASTYAVFQTIKPYLQSLSVIWRAFGNAIVQLQHDAYGVRRIAERVFAGDLNMCKGGCHCMPARSGSRTVYRQNIKPTLTGMESEDGQEHSGWYVLEKNHLWDGCFEIKSRPSRRKVAVHLQSFRSTSCDRPITSSTHSHPNGAIWCCILHVSVTSFS